MYMLLTSKMRRKKKPNSANPRGMAIPLIRRSYKTELCAQVYENLVSNKLISQFRTSMITARKESNGCSWCGAITGNCECEDSCRKIYRPSETQIYFIRRHTINKVLKLWSQWALKVSGTHHWSHFEGLLSPYRFFLICSAVRLTFYW